MDLNTCFCLCMYVCLFVRMAICMCVCIYVCMNVCSLYAMKRLSYEGATSWAAGAMCPFRPRRRFRTGTRTTTHVAPHAEQV